jgi:hypothetical protein
MVSACVFISLVKAAPVLLPVGVVASSPGCCGVFGAWVGCPLVLFVVGPWSCPVSGFRGGFALVVEVIMGFVEKPIHPKPLMLPPFYVFFLILGRCWVCPA